MRFSSFPAFLLLLLHTTAALAATPVAEDSIINTNPDASVALRAQAEIGAIYTVKHLLQVGTDGTEVSIPKDLGQETLYPYLRFQMDLDIGTKGRRNTLSFLYQPLSLRSTAAPTRDLQVGDVLFAEGRGIDFTYGFSFWRLTWMYDILRAPDKEIAFGVALQIRNANIVYSALDGSAVVASRNIGPVPILAFRGRGTITKKLWMAGEVQGFYANIPGVNGGSADVEGAIVDTSLKAGLAGPKGSSAFLSLRYVGGGAVGQSTNADPFTDGFTRNWLHLMSLSIGLELR
jgi:hypothetical protein